MRGKTAALLLAVLMLGACSSAPPARVEAPRASRLMPPQGIDMATDSRDYANEIKGRKLDFVARYYREPTSRWPTLSAAEAAHLSSNGIKVVAVWESHSHKPEYFSYASGYSDAVSAYRQAKSIGQPVGSAIYFAVDYNAPPSDIGASIEQYFRGIAAGLASVGGAQEYRVGVYGSGAVCEHLKQRRLAQYTWLSNSTAWRGYDGFADWNIRQSKSSSMLSFNHDWNEATDDYGGFLVGSQYSSL